MSKDFYVGLDVGTDSIGWAVTDTDYKLIKKRGQDFWGTYLFDEANTAVERRAQRTARRRTARRHQRLMLLQSLFAEEICKVDPTFFIRLKNSAYHLSDKDERITGKDVLFADGNFKDKDFYSKFPTVHHLRNYLIDGEVKDIRYLYLAVHHIVKNRGHFLFEGQSFDVKDLDNVKKAFTDINAFLSDFFGEEASSFSTEKLEEALAVIKSKELGKTDKTKKLKLLLGVNKDKQLEAAVKAVVGGKVKLSVLYKNEELDDIEVNFENEKFDEEGLPKIEAAVGIDEAELVRKLKAIYDWSVLSSILGDEKYISAAKINVYKKHEADLNRLKELVRELDGANGTLYKRIFKGGSDKDSEKSAKLNNYSAYIGMHNGRYVKKCKQKDFYDFLKKELKLPEDILADMDNGEFLPKQVSNSNGVIPYQVHLSELKAILNNAEKYFPFLKEEEDGFTVSEKIEKLMTFRIPYYVGPLHTGKFAWSKRNEGYENVSITPWNFDKAIDKDASEQEFIRRMTNKCTYLTGEDVLPASSFTYSEFTFLNELNNLKVNGVSSKEAKKVIYEYAKTVKKVTLSKCLNKLKEAHLVDKSAKKEDVFSGIDGDFKNSLAPYVTFKEIIGDKADTHGESCDEIIELITTVSDKSRLETALKKKYSSFLTDDEIKRIKSLNYAKWGTMSKKVLTDFYSAKCCDENGEVLSILQVMREENLNLMQVLGKYDFFEAIREHNKQFILDSKVTYKDVEELYCSPSVKRAIWRTLDLVKEIVKIMGCEPKKVFVEMARDPDDNGKKGKRTVSRKQQLIDLYNAIKDEEKDWIKEIESHDDTKFNSKKLVLYYMQMGRSMYSGKPIPLEHVFNTKICDIDHIHPQSKIKDDSFNNIVLAYKTENTEKGDVYPVSAEIQNKMTGFWKELKEKKLISEAKYERLTRKTPLTTDELADFINRQLVETRQSTKAIAELLKRELSSEIVYSKAGNADDFKDKYGLVKVREVNDLHHAKDAYVNIVVGNVYNTKFNHDARIFFRKSGVDKYNMKYLYSHDIPGAWKLEDKDKIIATYNKNTCRIVRFTSEGKGKLFEATIKTKREGLIPLKEGGVYEDTSKYGGYDSAATAYFTLIRGKNKKGKTVLSLEAVSIYSDLHFKGDKQKMIDYFNGGEFTDCEILVDKIKLNTLLCIDGSYAYLRGKTGVQVVLCNANELMLDNDSVKYLKQISNCFRDKKKYFLKELPVNKYITAENNLSLYDILVKKLKSPIYAGLSISGQAAALKEKRNIFIELSLADQMVVLVEVLTFMQCNSVLSDLTLIGGKSNCGNNRISKQIQDKKVKIILQSPTGHYRKVIDCTKFL